MGILQRHGLHPACAVANRVDWHTKAIKQQLAAEQRMTALEAGALSLPVLPEPGPAAPGSNVVRALIPRRAAAATAPALNPDEFEDGFSRRVRAIARATGQYDGY